MVRLLLVDPEFGDEITIWAPLECLEWADEHWYRTLPELAERRRMGVEGLAVDLATTRYIITARRCLVSLLCFLRLFPPAAPAADRSSVPYLLRRMTAEGLRDILKLVSSSYGDKDTSFMEAMDAALVMGSTSPFTAGAGAGMGPMAGATGSMFPSTLAPSISMNLQSPASPERAGLPTSASALLGSPPGAGGFMARSTTQHSFLNVATGAPLVTGLSPFGTPNPSPMHGQGHMPAGLTLSLPLAYSSLPFTMPSNTLGVGQDIWTLIRILLLGASGLKPIGALGAIGGASRSIDSPQV